MLLFPTKSPKKTTSLSRRIDLAAGFNESIERISTNSPHMDFALVLYAFRIKSLSPEYRVKTVFGGFFMYLFKNVLRGVLFSSFVSLMITLTLSVVFLFADIPDGILGVISVVIITLAAFSASFYSTQRCRQNGLKQGILCGAVLFLMLCILSLMFAQCRFSEWTAIKAAACFIAGALGGVWGINTKKTKG